MKRSIKSVLFALAIIVISSAGAIAQTQIKGFVQDSTDKSPLVGATVLLGDTGRGAIADEKGAFTLTGLKRNAENTIEISYLGYTTKIMVVTPTKASTTLAEPIRLKPDDLKVEDLVVQGKAPIAIQLGDTTQYNAGAYKTNPDATAGDLLAKMPGMKLKDDGSPESAGEVITKILVDGKSYFKDDPATALSSLPADVVESIQVFDEKSDEARFTGIDDGERTKTINIVTKAKRKDAYFGDYIGGYGTDNRYNLKTNTNLFFGDHRLTVGFGLNNINQSAISGGRFYGGVRSSGIQEAAGVKLNYSGEYKKSETKLTKLGVNYVFTNNKTETNNQTVQSWFPTTDFASRDYTEIYNNNTDRYSHSISADLESDINASNKIYFRPSVRINTSTGLQLSDMVTVQDNIINNQAINNKDNTSESITARFTFNWMHKFTDKQSITLGANGNFSNDNSTQLIKGSNSFWERQIWIDSLINQNSDDYNTDNSIGINFSYNYKLTDRSSLTANYSGEYNNSDADKKTYLFNPTSGLYEDMDVALSNVFNRDYFTNNVGVGYGYRIKDKLTFNVRAGYRRSSLQNDQEFPSPRLYDYKFNSFVANMSFDYYFTKNKRFSIFYNGRPSLPSMTQLQDVVNNTNQLKITLGNPDLDQSYTNMLGFHYSASNIEKSTTLRVYGFINNSINSFANNTRIMSQDTVISGVSVRRGAQVSSPVNINGQWNANLGVNYSFPVEALKSNINTSLSYNITRRPTIYNDVKSFTLSNSGYLDLGLTSNISQNLDFTISSSTGLTHSNNTSNSTKNLYINESVGVKFNWIVWKGFFVNADYSYNFNFYKPKNENDNNFNLLNAGVGKKFLKGQNAEIRISGFDILNQTKSIQYSVDANYTQNSISSVLQRYFMITFSYKFNTMKGKNMPASTSTGRPSMGGGMMMRMH